MPEPQSDSQIILRDLRERAKELNCLYAVEELTSQSDLALERIAEGVIAAIPPAWQYPDACQARIQLDGATYETPGYHPTAWFQKAEITAQGEAVGTLEVSYTRELPPADEGPFLAGERKLLEAIADRLGNCLTHRRLLAAMEKWRSAERELARASAPEWQVILDLLRRTDQNLLLRVARKMINYLRWSGATEADDLFRHFAGPADPDADPRLDRNQPLDRREPPKCDELAAAAFRIAAARLSDAEIVACIHQWIKLDRAAFLVDTLEHERSSLNDIADAVARYLRTAHGELELPAPTLMSVRVSLIRRVLTDQLDYINIAKNYLGLSDFEELLSHTIFPADGHGRLGGKAAGLLLAQRILQTHARGGGPLAEVRTPRTWYISSDALHTFIHENHLEDVFAQKYKDIEEIRQEYADIVQLFKNSHFPPDIVRGLSLALDELGDCPLIVRSSSLLEDRSGAAFSGKYKSLFVPNQGDKRTRLSCVLDAIAEVYASVLAPDPIEYRAERNLLDFQEGMAILVQEVVGRRVGDYFLPLAAGVGFSQNEFRWSPRIRREDGLLRLVPGLGTRAVDRTGDDFPVLVSPGQPGLRANASPDEVARYSPRFLDLINLRTNRFETVAVSDFFERAGHDCPALAQLVSVFDGGRLRPPLPGPLDPRRDDLVVTLEGLLSRTPLVRQLGEMLRVLRDALHTPVDIEFAHDGQNLYLLQCRAQSAGRSAAPPPIPRDIPPERIVFTARRFVSNGVIPGLTHLVYVDPERYAAAPRLDDLIGVGRAVGRLNKVLPKRRFALLGPGRWGSLGDIKLGVRVTYSDINNAALLIEIARRTGQYTPDLSFGTHFFQDLVEAGIRYLPLYPDDPDVIFNETFLTRTDNLLSHLAPEFAGLADLVRVIDVTAESENHVLRVLMNGDLDEAVAFLTAPDATIESPEATETMIEPPRHQFWRWRLRMAERIADQLDGEKYGVAGLYLFGSTESGAAGPGSDIDLLVHFRGTPEQRAALECWLEGWSLCLAEMNYLRTGYRAAGLLDVHFVTDDDIARKTSYAVKIGAITNPARALRTWSV